MLDTHLRMIILTTVLRNFGWHVYIYVYIYTHRYIFSTSVWQALC